MNKIIENKKYDTNTATLIGKFWNGYSEDNNAYVLEQLYRKGTGEFFLYAIGGPDSMYGEPFGYGYIRTSCILPYTEDKAKEWVGEHMDADVYEALFGEVEE